MSKTIDDLLKNLDNKRCGRLSSAVETWRTQAENARKQIKDTFSGEFPVDNSSLVIIVNAYVPYMEALQHVEKTFSIFEKDVLPTVLKDRPDISVDDLLDELRNHFASDAMWSDSKAQTQVLRTLFYAIARD